MRRAPLLPTALALAALAAPPAARAADPARELVVQLSAAAAAPAGGRIASPAALPAAAAQRFAALGLTATRTFRERLAPPPAAAAELPDLYDFHPGRIVLCEAADSGLAAQALRLLAADPLVDWAEPNRVRAVQLVGWSAPPVRAARPALAATLDSLPNDPLLRQGAQWALLNPGPAGMFGGVAGDDVHAPAAWRTSVGDNALKLAYADTGIDPAQPELGGLMPDGSPRISDAINVTGEPVPAVTDSFAHGTTVAGVMAARTNDGPHFLGSGMAGVCGGDGAGNAGCRIVPIKIAPGHSGEATSFDIARAMTYAADVGARAMNLSFGGDAPSRLERLALTYATLRGCAMVCAAGNQGFNDPTLPIWPAAYAQVGICIQVGASDPTDQRVVFSSYGPGLDLLAPGVNVYTTFMTYPSYYGATYPGGYVAASGTSYSAPHVAGAVGLLAAVRPELTDDDFQHVLRESADDVGAPGVDAQTGWGRLNLAAALAAVRPDLGLWHDEVPADAFAPDSSGVLAVGEGAPGTLQRFAGTSVPATRIAALAHVTLPDSFLDSVRVWPRVGGTMAVRGDFSLPFFAATAQVVGQTAAGFTLRGWIYSTAPDSCAGCADDYVPLAPDNVRFGFTVLGRVDRPPTVALLAPAADSAASPGDSLRLAWTATDPDTVSRVEAAFLAADGTRVPLGALPPGAGAAAVRVPCLGPADVRGALALTAFDDRGHADQATVTRPFTVRGGGCALPLARFAAGPSPFRGALTLAAPGPGEVRILDAGGRLVRRLETRGGPLLWDGRDERGGTAPPGLYFARFAGAPGVAVRRVVRLGR